MGGAIRIHDTYVADCVLGVIYTREIERIDTKYSNKSHSAYGAIKNNALRGFYA